MRTVTKTKIVEEILTGVGNAAGAARPWPAFGDQQVARTLLVVTVFMRNAVAAAIAAFAFAVPAYAAGPGPQRYFAADASRRTVHLTLLAGLDGENNGFNFDGYGRGELLVSVPLGWRLVVECDNRGGMRSSCAVVRDSLATRPAFPGAASPQPLQGLDPGAKASFSFRLTQTGSFRIASLVPGQEQARMWDVLEVTRGGRPSISARPGP